MKTCTVVCGYRPQINTIEGDLIGTDRGCLYLALNGYKDFVAIGDFDSVNDDEYKIIKDNSRELIKLNPVKDDTDLELFFLQEKVLSFLRVHLLKT